MSTAQRPRIEVKARLSVLGFACPSSEISELLGIAATKVFRNGDPVLPGATKLHRMNGWQLTSPVDPPNATAEAAVSALLDLLPDRTAFAKLPPEVEIQLTCTIFGYEERPYCYLRKEDVKRLAEIGANIDIDTYDLDDYDRSKAEPGDPLER